MNGIGSNDDLSGQLTKDGELLTLMSAFPSSLSDGGLCHAFGYGSGVFDQKEKHHSEMQQPKDADIVKNGEDQDPKMIDFIFTVEDSAAWHAENMQMNQNHYSSMANLLGPNFVAWVQNVGSGLYFNPYVDVPIQNNLSRQVKYGVISKEKMLQDLLQWDYLYVAGRLHKPTQTVINNDDEVQEACNRNLESAVAASLLVHSSVMADRQEEGISLEELFFTIANLSYAGDFRMQVGAEDSGKVKKLVQSPGQFPRWCNLYNESLNQLQTRGILQCTTPDSNNHNNLPAKLQWNCTDIASQKHLLHLLPARFQRLESSLESSKFGLILSQDLERIVSPATRVQGAKGLITAGLFKSLKYAGAKFAKGSFKTFNR
jgi:translocator assembly and maintenance protein 41